MAGGTEYLVLRRAGEGEWRELDGSWIASGAPKARRVAAESLGEDGEYVAVPVRSFKAEWFRFENVRRLLAGPKTSGDAELTKVGSASASNAGSASA